MWQTPKEHKSKEEGLILANCSRSSLDQVLWVLLSGYGKVELGGGGIIAGAACLIWSGSREPM